MIRCSTLSPKLAVLNFFLFFFFHSMFFFFFSSLIHLIWWIFFSLYLKILTFEHQRKVVLHGLGNGSEIYWFWFGVWPFLSELFSLYHPSLAASGALWWSWCIKEITNKHINQLGLAVSEKRRTTNLIFNSTKLKIFNS